MSKSKYNVVNPDVLIDKYGADALRLYEMFLGPLEQYKPWNTNGITGVGSVPQEVLAPLPPRRRASLAVTDEPATPAELKALHKAIQKVHEDIEKFSFNTSVSAVHDYRERADGARTAASAAILEPLVVLLSPYAPRTWPRSCGRSWATSPAASATPATPSSAKNIWWKPP
ncbi:MAG: class I tRNA ligase family protein [Hymenobacter sp.]